VEGRTVAGEHFVGTCNCRRPSAYENTEAEEATVVTFPLRRGRQPTLHLPLYVELEEGRWPQNSLRWKERVYMGSADGSPIWKDCRSWCSEFETVFIALFKPPMSNI
jgi:hypothetical protein